MQSAVTRSRDCRSSKNNLRPDSFTVLSDDKFNVGVWLCNLPHAFQLKLKRHNNEQDYVGPFLNLLPGGFRCGLLRPGAADAGRRRWE
jgi:hypothetical protein